MRPPIGRDVLDFTAETPFGLRDDIFGLLLSLPRVLWSSWIILERAVAAFDKTWASKHRMIAETWRARWDLPTPFLAFPEEIRRIAHATNSIDAAN